MENYAKVVQRLELLDASSAALIAAGSEMLDVLKDLITTGYYSTEVGNRAIELIRRLDPEWRNE